MPITGLPTAEELSKIREYIMLPVLLDVVSKYHRKMEFYPTAETPVPRGLTGPIMDAISEDIKRIKGELRDAKIKIYDGVYGDGGLTHEFTCRGYQDRFWMIHEVLKAELGVMLGKYVRRLQKR